MLYDYVKLIHMYHIFTFMFAIGDVMVSVLSSSAVESGIEP
jgi:hypothetical protein